MSTNVIIIPDESLFVPSRLGKLIITHDDQKFSVIDSKGLKSDIQRADLDKDLRDVSSETLKKMTDVGYLSINERGTDYALKYNVRGLGGGFITANIAYVGTVTVGEIIHVTGCVVETVLKPIGGVFSSVGNELKKVGTATVQAAPIVYDKLLSLPTA
jgi:hypothetical protein